MNQHTSHDVSRRMLFRSAFAAAGVAAAAQLSDQAEAHDLRPGDPAYAFDRYEAIVNRRVRIRQIYAWPGIQNPIIYANIANGLNGFQFSYGVPADQIQVVVQAYFSANAALYDDYIWQKYKLGEAFNVKDPATGAPATQNLWYKSKIAAQDAAAPPKDRTHPYYTDVSIEGLQRRGVLFLI